MTSKISKYRLRSFHYQAGRCYYCGVQMWINDLPGFARRIGSTIRQARQLKCTAEHLTARQDGGANCADNIVAACYYCNTRRHRSCKPLPPEEYRIRVQSRVASGRWNRDCCSVRKNLHIDT